jgi:hypothetical protein
VSGLEEGLTQKGFGNVYLASVMGRVAAQHNMGSRGCEALIS